MGDYKYKLQYIDEDYISQIEFKADIGLETLRDNLRYFLLSCSWAPEQVTGLLGSD